MAACWYPILQKFRFFSENPHACAASAKEKTGKSVIGFFCSYVPEELIHAAGAIPFRIFGAGGDIELAGSHLQAYCCSLVRGGLEDALQGRLDFLDGTVFPHTCDSIQRLSDIWRLNAGFDIHIDAVMPVKLNTPSARAYMLEVLAGFRGDLQKALGRTITDADIASAVRLYNRIRSSLSVLYEMQSIDPAVMGPEGLYCIMKASMFMDRDELARDLENLVASLEKTAAGFVDTGRKRVMLSGSICTLPDIYGIIRSAGGDVVWDDLCTGRRYAGGLTDETGDPLEALASRYAGGMICPSKHYSPTARGESLFAEVHRKAIDGVVFLRLKFCDPHAFDYPYLKDLLDREKVASLLLEIGEQPPSGEYLRTRIETFIAML